MSCLDAALGKQRRREIPKGWQPRSDEERENYAKMATRRMMGGAKLEDMPEIILEEAKGVKYTTHGMRMREKRNGGKGKKRRSGAEKKT